MNIRKLIRKIIYGYKADSDSYISHLKKSGCSIGDGCVIYSPMKTSIDEPGFMLKIGNNVRITEGVTILCHDASVYTLDIAQKMVGGYFCAPRAFKKTIIGNNVFIGRYAILTMGTHVGDNVIIGAGSVCHGVLQSDSVYGGNPARRICSLETYNNRCAEQYLHSAKEYARELQNSLGRVPEINEMYDGFKPLFGRKYPGYVDCGKYPIFGDVESLLEQSE